MTQTTITIGTRVHRLAHTSVRGPRGLQGDPASVTPAAVQSALSADQAAGRAALALGTAATTDASDYDPTGSAASAVTAHESAPDPHPQYTTAAEAVAAAAAASIAAGDIYPDTAAGLAATTTGQYFSVPGADAGDYLILYRNDAGSAVEVKRYPSTDAVQKARRAVTTVTPGAGVVTIDIALGDYFIVRAESDIDQWVFTNASAARGERLTIAIVNRGHAVAWPANFTWDEGSAPTLGAAYTSDTVTLTSLDGGATWRASFSAGTNVGGDAALSAALSLSPVWLYDHKDVTSFYRDTAMTIPAQVGDPVRAVRDKSGNGNHRTTPADSSAGILRQSGDLYYIESDGVDDYMVTPAVNLTATDAVTVCMGLRKLSDASLGVFFESSSTMANNGTFSIHAPPGASATIRVASRGTVTKDATVGSLAAPITRVVTLTSDISADSLAIRLNRAAGASSVGDQGTGNYSNTPHYFWMRGGASFPAKVYDYGGALYASKLEGADLAIVEAFVTDRTAQPVAQPSGFSWVAAPDIITDGSGFTTSFDIDAMRPATSVTYYIDPVSGSDANDGLTEGTPRAKLSTTVALANAGGVAAKFLCKPGVYRGDVGWFGAAPTVDFILEPWAADPSDPANRIWFILPAAADPFVYDKGAGLPGYRSTGFYVSDPWAVLDQAVLDENGLPRKYEKAANYATYLATPGTWWRETTGTYANRLFVRPFDDRDLRALFLAGQPHRIEVLTTGGGNNFRFDATTSLTLWVQNACFIDGSNNVWIKDASPGLTINVYFKDVVSVGSVLGDGMGFHALYAGSTIKAYLTRCGTGYNLSDGFDYRADPAVPTAAAFGFENECFTAHNGYDASGANNASTAHGQSTVISLNCDYSSGSQNRVVNDIETSKRWMIGCAVGPSTSTDASAVSVQAGSLSGSHTAQIWLQTCDISDSAAAAVYAASGCAVRYRATSLAGLTLDGAGLIEPF